MRHLTPLLLLLASCASSSRPIAYDAATDASADASVDAFTPPDLGTDAGTDSGTDAAVDAFVCECSAGPCCDGCHFRAPSFQCSTRNDPPSYPTGCTMFTGNVCGAAGYSRIILGAWNRWCSGTSSACDGATSGTVFEQAVPCDADGASPWASACILDAAGARCEVCP